MRTLRVFESITVDGYFADATDGIGWAHVGADDAEFVAWVEHNASAGGDLLFGRKTYQMMEAFWPTPAAADQMPVVARGMNAATKHVVSRTIEPAWENARLLAGELRDAVSQLKDSRGPDITILGSGSVAAQLDEAGLVDEFQFVIIPIALGAGRRLFTGPRDLTLVEHRAFPGGRIALTYATGNRPPGSS